MKITIAGTGYVGLVTAVCLAEKGHFVTCVDVDEKKVETLRKNISPIYEPGLQELMVKNEHRLTYTTDYKKAYSDADVIFIGVGTPEQEDGTANLSFVRAVARQIAENVTRDCVVVVKSTVQIGTNDEVEDYIKTNLKKSGVKISVASNPEFLAQGNAVKDTLHAKRIVLGVEDDFAKETLLAVYEPFELPMVVMNRRSAEMTKYASNDFLALKISYINEIANLCELVGANIKDVTKGMSLDPRIGDKFLHAGIGYGGSCFPKDTKALYHLAQNKYGYEMKTIKAAIDVNALQKTKLFYEARKSLGRFDGKNVTVLGLTFKPNTDDLREAPSLDLIKLLEKDGAIIHAYDPVGMNNFKKTGLEVKLYETAQKANEQSEIVFVLTEWEEIAEADYQNKIVYDGRNCIKNKKGIIKYSPIGNYK